MAQDLNFGQSEPKPKGKKTITVVIFFIIILAIIYVAGRLFEYW